ncbi:MAG: hypothetical protein EAY75_07310 [Bacteroidetes bacterium]|nr:MAG: hypothetical protein EAY75_07310 [Bacteroidota bacterium]
MPRTPWLLCCIAAVWAPLLVFSQMPAERLLYQKVQAFEKHPHYTKDTAYLNAVNAWAFQLADANPDSALRVLARQIAFCKAIGYVKGEMDAHKILGNAYQNKANFADALISYNDALELATHNKFPTAVAGILNNIGITYSDQGNYQAALTNYYKALPLAEKQNDTFVIGAVLNNIANIYYYQGKFKEAGVNYQRLLDLSVAKRDTAGIILAYRNLGEVELELGTPEVALQSLQKAKALALAVNNTELQEASARMMAKIFAAMDSSELAQRAYNDAISISTRQGYLVPRCQALLGLARVYQNMGNVPTAISTALEGLRLAQSIGQVQVLKETNELLADLYLANGNASMALEHYKGFKRYSDTLNILASDKTAVALQLQYNFAKKEHEYEKASLKQLWLALAALVGLLAVAVVAVVFYRSRQSTKQLYVALQEKAGLVEAQKQELEETIVKLNETQSLLVQSEKMASLAELTAGIAHEIQNPLNFVNNFSDVSAELLQEMVGEIEKGNLTDATEIAADVQSNLQKILHHGKRADAIVKGMLQHSRTGSGHKEPVNINALADEYLRLAYHGLRAKDNSFNATMKTDFDASIVTINAVPQDMGRVLLNLITNAFYVVTEKKKSGVPDYIPTIWVSTKKSPPWIEITVRDNGNGIPEHILSKIFQPFFTTKPSGQGTGLGLSLSYDIVKAHGGELSVQNQPGLGAAFVIKLPVGVPNGLDQNPENEWPDD